jgi:beta-lactamase superfamily II metal-dependent hydrolase
MVMSRKLRIQGVEEMDHCVVTHLVKYHSGELEVFKEAYSLRIGISALKMDKPQRLLSYSLQCLSH